MKKRISALLSLLIIMLFMLLLCSCTNSKNASINNVDEKDTVKWGSCIVYNGGCYSQPVDAKDITTLPSGYEYWGKAGNKSAVEIAGKKVRDVMTFADCDDPIYIVSVANGTKLYKNADNEDTFYLEVSHGHYREYTYTNQLSDLEGYDGPNELGENM